MAVLWLSPLGPSANLDDSDLLWRVRQDIQVVHQDLIQRIQSMHLDVRRLMGVLIPDLEQALAQQNGRQVHTLSIPPHISDEFKRAAVADRPEFTADDTSFNLEEIADAFVLHYRCSTVDFQPGILLESRFPPLAQYINLLKCVWLMDHMRTCSRMIQPDPDSHWPSYVRQLEDVSASMSFPAGFSNLSLNAHRICHLSVNDLNLARSSSFPP